MKIRIKRIDKSLPLPEYHTDGSVGFDLYAREDVEIKPRELALIPLNVIIETPEPYMLALIPRSSTFKRTGLICSNSFGVVDRDYCGEEDELMFQVYNITDIPAIVKKGERIAQGVFYPVGKVVDWVEVSEMGVPSRGRFGSTGVMTN